MRPGRRQTAPTAADKTYGSCEPYVGSGNVLPVLSLEDRHRAWGFTLIALVGLIVGTGLAVFGMPPAGLHSPLHHLGIMDPLCGGTRALRLTLLGHWRDAWRYNPLSPVLAVGAALVVLRHMAGTLTNRWVTVRVPVRVLILAAVVVSVPLEINQQLHAALLMRP